MLSRKVFGAIAILAWMVFSNTANGQDAGQVSSESQTPQSVLVEQNDEANTKKEETTRLNETNTLLTGTGRGIFLVEPKNSVEQPFYAGAPSSFFDFGKAIVEDQRTIWTSPAHIRFDDAQWLIPVSGLTAGFLATDRYTSRDISHDPGRVRNFRSVANGGTAGLVGVAGGMYLWSLKSKDPHQRETGFLAGESALNSFITVEALKFAFQRPRPNEASGTGKFFEGGASFPSAHAAVAWSIAGIVAHEYPGPLTKLLAYGAATAVSFSRVQSRDHFPADVFVGSTLGWLIAQNIYRRRHNAEYGGGEWRSIGEIVRDGGNGSWGGIGTTYVPLDSWVYPTIDRLAGMNLVNTAFLGTRPWTRLECARLVQEAEDSLGVLGESSDKTGATSAVRSLYEEFSDVFAVLGGGSNSHIGIDSIYTRTSGISGTPLNDGEHFGQTFVNDYGRPYREGFNNVTGLSASATYGFLSVYARGEYQHAPSASAYPFSARQAISLADNIPIAGEAPFSEVNEFRLLEAYAGVRFENWEFTFGKQSLWWGPGTEDSLLFSNNAESIYMFRGSRVAPFTLPWIFSKLGPAKVDFFFGKLSGHSTVPRPVIHGERITFKPTPNLEFGVSRTAVLGGVGRPLTLGAIWNSYTSYTSSTNYADNVNPGKRYGGFDFSYRIPYLRNWLTIYADSISNDDPSPLAAPRRAGIVPGFYLSHIPKVPKVDLRFEAGYTDIATGRSVGGTFIYWDAFYRDVYANKQNILGSWIGREGQGYAASSTYWFRPKTNFKFSFRHARVSSDFIPHGASQTNGAVEANFSVSRDVSISTALQYEQWNISVLAPEPQKNVSAVVQLTFFPKALKK